MSRLMAITTVLLLLTSLGPISPMTHGSSATDSGPKWQTAFESDSLLGADPLGIFLFVRNNIVFEPYYGYMKGATGTLNSGCGNDFDQASLLVNLFRRANIQARYVKGTVSLSIDELKNWFGVGLSESALRLLNYSGIPHSVQGSNEQSLVHLTHVWVEAYLNGSWVSMDPSFKQSTCHEYMASPLPPDLWGISKDEFFAPARFAEAYDIAGIDAKQILRSVKYMQNLAIQGEFLKIQSLSDRSIKPAGEYTMPSEFKVETVHETIPASEEYRVQITFPSYDNQTSRFVFTRNFTATIPSWAFSLSRATIYFVPKTAEMAEYLRSLPKGFTDENLDLNKVRMCPVFAFNSTSTVMGADMPLGRPMPLHVRVLLGDKSHGGYDSGLESFPIQVGTWSSLVVNTGRTLRQDSILFDRIRRLYVTASALGKSTVRVDDIMGGMFDIHGRLYFNIHSQLKEGIDNALGLVSISKVAVATTGYRYDWIRRGAGWNLQYSGPFMHWGILGSTRSVATKNDVSLRSRMILRGLQLSTMGGYLEAALLRLLYNVTPVSCSSILEMANEKGIPIFLIHRDNWDKVYPKISLPDEAFRVLQARIQREGRIAIIPQRAVSGSALVMVLSDKTVRPPQIINLNYTGWLDYDPNTGQMLPWILALTSPSRRPTAFRPLGGGGCGTFVAVDPDGLILDQVHMAPITQLLEYHGGPGSSVTGSITGAADISDFFVGQSDQGSSVTGSITGAADFSDVFSDFFVGQSDQGSSVTGSISGARARVDTDQVIPDQLQMTPPREPNRPGLVEQIGDWIFQPGQPRPQLQPQQPSVGMIDAVRVLEEQHPWVEILVEGSAHNTVRIGAETVSVAAPGHGLQLGHAATSPYATIAAVVLIGFATNWHVSVNQNLVPSAFTNWERAFNLYNTEYGTMHDLGKGFQVDPQHQNPQRQNSAPQNNLSPKDISCSSDNHDLQSFMLEMVTASFKKAAASEPTEIYYTDALTAVLNTIFRQQYSTQAFLHPLELLPFRGWLVKQGKPNLAMYLIDKEGRRTGYDPATGSICSGSPYLVQYSGGIANQTVYLWNPRAGDYTLVLFNNDGEEKQLYLTSMTYTDDLSQSIAQKVTIPSKSSIASPLSVMYSPKGELNVKIGEFKSAAFILFSKDQGRVIRGQLLDEHLSGLGGREVNLFYRPSLNISAAWRAFGSCKTSADGNFVFDWPNAPPGSLEIRATYADLFSAHKTINIPFTVKMDIVNLDGKPLADGEIKITTGNRTTLSTVRNGSVTFEAVPGYNLMEITRTGAKLITFIPFPVQPLRIKVNLVDLKIKTQTDDGRPLQTSVEAISEKGRSTILSTDEQGTTVLRDIPQGETVLASTSGPPPSAGLAGFLGAKTVFEGWMGDSSGSPESITVTLHSSREVVAVWRIDYGSMYLILGGTAAVLAVACVAIQRKKVGALLRRSKKDTA